MRSALLLTALLSLAAGCAGGRAYPETFVPASAREVRADARPAPGPYPTPPGIEFAAGEPPPAPADLPADGAVAGRLTAEGQTAVLRFQARKGELSLFALTAYGYARGWDATSRLVVRDAGGAVLAERTRSGPAQFDDFLPFLVREDGDCTLEVVAAEHFFRYVVVRHTGYHPQLRGDALALVGAADEVAHGWVGGPGAQQRFVVHAPPGSVVYLHAEPTVERARKGRRAYRARTAAVHAGFVDPARLAGVGDPRTRRDDSFPEVTLGVADRAADEDAPPLVTLSCAGAAALLRVPASGAVCVTVTQVSEGPGGLFDLTVERGVTVAPLVVRVGDAADEPLANVEVALLKEPELELVGRGRTGADGTLTLEAPPGDHTVVHRAPGGRPESVRTVLAADEPLNLVVGG